MQLVFVERVTLKGDIMMSYKTQNEGEGLDDFCEYLNCRKNKRETEKLGSFYLVIKSEMT